jgi:hypothetical protein
VTVSFEQIANERQMTSANSVLGELTWDVEPNAYQKQRVPPDSPLDALLNIMTRRALEPTLVTYLLDGFPDRPLERALLAWDVAHNSLLGRNDNALAGRLAHELAPLKKLGPRASVAIPRDRLASFMDAVQPAGDAGVVSDFTTMPSLAALIRLAATPKAVAENPEIVEAVLSYAKRLAYGHLPSLGIAFLQILWDRFAVQKALDLMIDLAVDHRMYDALPVMSGEDDRSMQQQTYLLVRASCRDYNVESAARTLEAMDEHPAIKNWNDPSLSVARAELVLLQDKPMDEGLRKIVDSAGAPKSRHPADNWRYGMYVRSAMQVRLGPGSAAAALDTFITMFGDDTRLWSHATLRPDARAELLTLLSREVRYASHDPEVWQALAMMNGYAQAIPAEVTLRAGQQVAAAFS